MISKSTLILTGAGASMDFGYPSGKTLVNEILHLLSFPTNIRYQISKYNVNKNELKEEWAFIKNTDKDFFINLGYSEEDLFHFSNTLKHSHVDSIDVFLERRNEFIELGKLCIACVIHRFEDRDRLSFSNETWLRYLWNLLDAEVNNFFGNQLTIATFNYDRILEQYLFMSIKNKYVVTDDKAKLMLNHFNIIHLHGRLSDLSWEGEYGYEYGFSKDYLQAHYNLIKESSNRINIISESLDQSQLNNVRQQIEDVEQVFFLGFGFHPTNIERLRLSNINRGLTCTAWGLTEKEGSRTKLDTQNKFLLKYDMKNLELLRNYLELR